MTVDDERLDELFALPVERFTDERTALVKELKSAGDREDAAMVQSLRKPTVAAWAVNQLARTRASDVQELLETGARLREAQQKALSGGGARELQEAGARRRELVDHLVEAAGKLLESGGYSAARARLDEVANTLLATATDDAAAAAVRRGRLEKELPPPAGFGDFGELATVIPMPSRPKAKSARAEGTPGRGAKAKVESAAQARARKRAGELREQAEAAEEEARQRRADADRADADAMRLKDEWERADRAAAKAGREADRAEGRAAQARERADRALERLRE